MGKNSKTRYTKMKIVDDSTRYNVNHYLFLGFALAHGTFIDLRLWRPQSGFWKHRISEYKRLAESDIFPPPRFATLRMGKTFRINIPQELRIRCEIVDRLASVFIDDAAQREFENTGKQEDEQVQKRASKQMCKYLSALNTKLKELA